MKKWIFCFLFLSACQGSLAPQNLSTKASARDSGIVGGTIAGDTDVLQQRIFLYETTIHGKPDKDAKKGKADDNDIVSDCTTSAITRRVFILAAHCIRKDSYKAEVFFNKANGDQDSIKVIKSVVHEDYTPQTPTSDLALILLEKDAPGAIQYSEIPDPTHPIYPALIQAAGFGLETGIDEDNNDIDGALRTTQLNVLKFDITQPRFLVDQTHGHGICQGDSGGPAMIIDQGVLYTVGIASETLYDNKAKPLNLCNDQAYYVSVQFYYPWLNQHINELIQSE